MTRVCGLVQQPIIMLKIKAYIITGWATLNSSKNTISWRRCNSIIPWLNCEVYKHAIYAQLNRIFLKGRLSLIKLRPKDRIFLWNLILTFVAYRKYSWNLRRHRILILQRSSLFWNKFDHATFQIQKIILTEFNHSLNREIPHRNLTAPQSD